MQHVPALRSHARAVRLLHVHVELAPDGEAGDVGGVDEMVVLACAEGVDGVAGIELRHAGEGGFGFFGGGLGALFVEEDGPWVGGEGGEGGGLDGVALVFGVVWWVGVS